jgi:ABC-2 type transport system permease protein
MFRRIGAMVRKEFIQLRRDKRTLAMMILLPVIWLIAFGYAVNFDINTIRVYAVDRAANGDSREVLKEVDGEEKFVVHGKLKNEQEAKKVLEENTADVVLIFPEGYRRMPQKESEKLRIQVDGSRLFTAQSALRKINEVLFDVQKKSMDDMKQEIQDRMKQGAAPEMDIQDQPQMQALLRSMPPERAQAFIEGLKKAMKEQAQKQMDERWKEMENEFPRPGLMKPEVDVLYNPDLKSVQYMIPGLVGLVLIFITTLMTALGIVREKERGTLEQLVVSPLRSMELILGKLLPYFLIALVDFLLVFLVGVRVFDVPFRGDFLPFLLVSLLFLIGSLGMGLLISTVSQNQQQAMQLAVLTLVPQFILSGFVFPLEAMPWGIRWLSYLMPLTYFIPVSRGVFLKGLSPLDYTLSLAVLGLYALLFIIIASVRFRRSLT